MSTNISGINVATPPANKSGVGSGATASQARWAAQLASDAGVIATFGGNTSAVQTYDAVGILNGVLQASANGQKAADTTPDAPATNDGGDSSGATGSGTTAPATPITGSTDVNANWVQVMKNSPIMAYQVVADSVNQGLIASL